MILHVKVKLKVIFLIQTLFKELLLQKVLLQKGLLMFKINPKHPLDTHEEGVSSLNLVPSFKHLIIFTILAPPLQDLFKTDP